MAQSTQPHGQPNDQSTWATIVRNDGKPHPLQDTLAGITVVLGIIAIATCGFRGLHILASWTGLFGIFTAVWGQYISATTAERFLLIIGGGASAVGFGIALAHGGLLGGVVGY
jgi:hypothetical protein